MTLCVAVCCSVSGVDMLDTFGCFQRRWIREVEEKGGERCAAAVLCMTHRSTVLVVYRLTDHWYRCIRSFRTSCDLLEVSRSTMPACWASVEPP